MKTLILLSLLRHVEFLRKFLQYNQINYKLLKSSKSLRPLLLRPFLLVVWEGIQMKFDLWQNKPALNMKIFVTTSKNVKLLLDSAQY